MSKGNLRVLIEEKNGYFIANSLEVHLECRGKTIKDIEQFYQRNADYMSSNVDILQRAPDNIWLKFLIGDTIYNSRLPISSTRVFDDINFYIYNEEQALTKAA